MGAKPTLRKRIPWVLAIVVLGAVFPRLVYWPVVRGRSRRIAYTAFDAAFRFVRLQWMGPYAERLQAQRQSRQKELHRDLGRDPTEQELRARLRSGRA